MQRSALRLVGWALVILALATSGLGWNVFVFALFHSMYIGTEWWWHAREAVAPLGYLIAGMALILLRSRKGWLISAAALGLAIITPLFNFASALYRGFATSQWPLFGLEITAVPIVLILIALRCLLNEAFSTTAIGVPQATTSGVSPQGKSLGAQEASTGMPRRVKALFWSIIGTGVVLPWAVGLVVREELRKQGKPVLSAGHFLGRSLSELPSGLLFTLAMTAVFASPFLILAFLAKSWLTSATATPIDATSYVRRLASIVAGLLGTVVGTVYLYIGVWREFDALFLFTPLPLLPLVGTAGGLLAGWFLSVMVQSASRRHRVD